MASRVSCHVYQCDTFFFTSQCEDMYLMSFTNMNNHTDFPSDSASQVLLVFLRGCSFLFSIIPSFQPRNFFYLLSTRKMCLSFWRKLHRNCRNVSDCQSLSLVVVRALAACMQRGGEFIKACGTLPIIRTTNGQFPTKCY